MEVGEAVRATSGMWLLLIRGARQGRRRVKPCPPPVLPLSPYLSSPQRGPQRTPALPRGIQARLSRKVQSPSLLQQARWGCQIAWGLGCPRNTRLHPRLGFRNAVQSSARQAGWACGTPRRTAVPRAPGIPLQDGSEGVGWQALGEGRDLEAARAATVMPGGRQGAARPGHLFCQTGPSLVLLLPPSLHPPALPQLFPWPRSCCSNRSGVSGTKPRIPSPAMQLGQSRTHGPAPHGCSCTPTLGLGVFAPARTRPHPFWHQHSPRRLHDAQGRALPVP